MRRSVLINGQHRTVYLAICCLTSVLCWTTIEQCEDVCSLSDDYASGHWERISNVPLASSAQQLESTFGYTNHTSYHLGNWEPHFCSRRPDDFARAQESLLWRWQPDGCSLFDFRPIRTQRHSLGALLAKLGPRKIIYVGDSLVLEQYLSLEGLLGSEIVGAQSEFVYINGRMHGSQAASFMTRSGLQVSYTRSDFLVNKETMEMDTPQETGPAGLPAGAHHYTMTNTSHLGCCSSPWAHLLNHPSSYLVLTTSAHWATFRGTGPDRHAAAVQTVARHLAANFRGERIFVRASVPGHPQCHLAKGPYSDAQYEHDSTWHNWGEFAAHNEAWKSALKALNDSRFLFLDVEPMTRARPDSHLRPGAPDCLHYCLPGVIDYWTLLLASFWMSCRG